MFEFSDLAPDVREKLALLVLWYYQDDRIADDTCLTEGEFPRKVIEIAVRELYNREMDDAAVTKLAASSYDERWARVVAYHQD